MQPRKRSLLPYTSLQDFAPVEIEKVNPICAINLNVVGIQIGMKNAGIMELPDSAAQGGPENRIAGRFHDSIGKRANSRNANRQKISPIDQDRHAYTVLRRDEAPANPCGQVSPGDTTLQRHVFAARRTRGRNRAQCARAIRLERSDAGRIPGLRVPRSSCCPVPAERSAPCHRCGTRPGRWNERRIRNLVDDVGIVYDGAVSGFLDRIAQARVLSGIAIVRSTGPKLMFKQSPPESICVVRLSAIGDTCHALAVVRAIQDTWPESQITWIIGRTESGLMADIPDIEFIIFDKGKGRKAYGRREIPPERKNF